MISDIVKTLRTECFSYQRPTVLAPPPDYLDLDLGLVVVDQRTEAETQEMALLSGEMGELMEYPLLNPDVSWP